MFVHVEGSLSLSRWKKNTQPEREEYRDDKDSNDPFAKPDVREMIKAPSKCKRKPEINSSNETKRKRLPKILKKRKSRNYPSSAASPNSVKRLPF